MSEGCGNEESVAKFGFNLLASFVQGHNAKEEQFLASPHDMMIPIFLVAFQSGPRVYRVCYDLGIGHLAS